MAILEIRKFGPGSVICSQCGGGKHLTMEPRFLHLFGGDKSSLALPRTAAVWVKGRDIHEPALGMVNWG